MDALVAIAFNSLYSMPIEERRARSLRNVRRVEPDDMARLSFICSRASANDRVSAELVADTLVKCFRMFVEVSSNAA